MSTAKRTIAVVTGTRAEFGLLRPVMHAIDQHPDLTLRTIVTGVHLTTGSWRDIKQAGFTIDARAAMQRPNRTGRAADVQALGKGIATIGKALETLKPDVVLLLGDRIEAFAAASAASVGGYRTAHLHGGDRAEGVADEAMRHAISKLAHLHFPATAASRRRLIRMGEDPAAVWNVGSPAADGLASITPAPDAPEVIVMQHPIGQSDDVEHKWMQGTLAATKRYRTLVLTPNHDPGRDGIMRAIAEANVRAITHLPRPAFLAALRGASAIVGNSSAGLIEAAILRCPCVNVGSRQAGRERPSSVIDCDYGHRNVQTALKKAIALDLTHSRHPYGSGHTGQRIAKRLASTDLTAIPVRKRNTY